MSARDLYTELQPAYRRTLLAPQDDMWATFADLATPHALECDGHTAGCCAVNDDREMLFFHASESYRDRAGKLFGEAIRRLDTAAAVVCTNDPLFRSVCEAIGAASEATALLYRHEGKPSGAPLAPLRVATMDDHTDAVAFSQAATGMPRAFLEPYLAGHIGRGDILLHEDGGEIVATGECRTDLRQRGYAHLGIVVATDRRGHGLGSGLMHALVLEARQRGLTPLCSTEPNNVAARRAIDRAGFREYHRVMRVALSGV